MGPRTAALTERARKAIADHLDLIERDKERAKGCYTDDGLIFATESGRPMTPATCSAHSTFVNMGDYLGDPHK